MKRLFIVAALLACTSACGSSSSPTTPTPTPSPTPSMFTLSGHVTSTTGGPVSGARVAIADGPNANRTATTDGGGAYSMSSLTQSGFTVQFTAPNYAGVSLPANLVSNITLDAQLQPIPLFAQSGVGNAVFSMPSTVSRVRITGTYTGNSSNFIVWEGPPNVACGNVITGSCSLIVNDLIGTSWGRTVSDGTYQMTGQTQISIINSTGVAWSFTEAR